VLHDRRRGRPPRARTPPDARAPPSIGAVKGQLVCCAWWPAGTHQHSKARASMPAACLHSVRAGAARTTAQRHHHSSSPQLLTVPVAAVVPERAPERATLALLLGQPAAGLWQLHEQLLVAELPTPAASCLEGCDAHFLRLLLLLLARGRLERGPQGGERLLAGERPVAGLLSLHLQRKTSHISNRCGCRCAMGGGIEPQRALMAPLRCPHTSSAQAIPGLMSQAVSTGGDAMVRGLGAVVRAARRGGVCCAPLALVELGMGCAEANLACSCAGRAHMRTTRHRERGRRCTHTDGWLSHPRLNAVRSGDTGHCCGQPLR
jgi:hypothetical protein